MYSATVHQITFSFDRARNALVFTGQLENGFGFEVLFPIGHVSLTFDREAATLGYIGEPVCGAIDTVDGFLGAIEVLHQRELNEPEAALGWFGSSFVRSVGRAASSVAKTVTKPVATVASKAYNATIKKVGQQALRIAAKGAKAVSSAGMAIARSKLVGTALAGAAVAFPAVGAPALAAWGAANRAVATYDAARQGVRTAQKALGTLQSNARALTQSRTPVARMAIAGLRSYRFV